MATTNPISFEIKSQLAKLLATENITMLHDPKSFTASFDTKNRILTLPMWTNISDDLYDMLVVHEVGHALDTPSKKWMSSIADICMKYHNDKSNTEILSSVRDFMNIIEDVRIEKRQKIRYPGSKRNFVLGYKELYDRDFFGINSKDTNSLSFIDRANIYFKNGTHLNIKFDAAEKVLINKISSTETFDDVINLTDEIYGIYLKKAKEEQITKGVLTTDDVMDIYDQDEDGDENDNRSLKEDDFESDDNVNEKTDSDEETSQTGKHLVPESVTEKAAKESFKSIVVQSNVEYVNLTLPKCDLSKIVDDYKVVIKEMKKDYPEDYMDTKFLEWRRKEMDTISFMVKEFEMRKSADTYARQSIAKTGVINTNKLHTYKYNDDIFRKLTVVPEGKNHGFVMFLDWSRSMSGNIHNTMKQLFSLTMFCNRVHIPFEVYLFRTHVIYDEKVGSQFIVDPNKNNLFFSPFKIRNILSSRMNTKEMNDAFNVLWKIGSNEGSSKSDLIDGTPLNQTIFAADQIVNDFTKKYKLQIVNTVILTDGSSDASLIVDGNCLEKYYSNKSAIVLTDPVTKKTYHIKNIRSYNTTTILLKILKERTNTNLIGFYITYDINRLGFMFDISDKVKKDWKNNKFVGISNAGYDEYFLVKFEREQITQDLKVDPTMKKGAITKAFVSFAEKKKTNRQMIKTLMDRVAKNS